ncbi:MAG: DUF4268 domain-containing protein [Gemmatimonadota bacterium]
MTIQGLGRLERVSLREVWTSEATEFTPWLAQDENLALLGDSIGLELELEAQEKDVGPFRADLLCKDTATDSWVLIENQLERTDHTHLGQLMTYAAGLNAVTIVWIAERFTEEHRAALDWLNEITDEKINFFGLEVELWRIGTSPVAPKFNLVSQPNDWTKTISTARRGIESQGLTETKRLQRDYWAGLADLLRSRGSPVKPQKPLPQHWTNFAVGRSNFSFQAFVNTQKDRIGVELVMTGPDAKPHFYLLRQEKEQIETEVGAPLSWLELPHRKESRITLRLEQADPTNVKDWTAQHDWLANALERYHQAFVPRVRKLSAAQYSASEGAPLEQAP